MMGSRFRLQRVQAKSEVPLVDGGAFDWVAKSRLTAALTHLHPFPRRKSGSHHSLVHAVYLNTLQRGFE